MNLKDIPLGVPLLYSNQFCPTPITIVKLSDDYTGLNRDIAYFRYEGRGNNIKPNTFASLISEGRKDDAVSKIDFALWQWTIDNFCKITLK